MHPDTRLRKVAAIFQRHNFTSVPVVGRQCLSRRDLPDPPDPPRASVGTRSAVDHGLIAAMAAADPGARMPTSAPPRSCRPTRPMPARDAMSALLPAGLQGIATRCRCSKGPHHRHRHPDRPDRAGPRNPAAEPPDHFPNPRPRALTQRVPARIACASRPTQPARKRWNPPQPWRCGDRP